MEKSETEPLAPTKPPEIDPELNATAATAVEQWRNYQQAYAAYQQQYAAYQQYIQQRQYAQTVEQQQMAYTQYLERHSQYQYQLQQYEQHHHQQQQQQVPPPADGMPCWPTEPYALPNPMLVQQPTMPVMHQPAGNMNGYHAVPPGAEPRGDYAAAGSAFAKNRKRTREPRAKVRPNEKKSELHTKTVIYVNPDDETMLPVDLKQLFKEFQCDLCRTRMNSHISANIHYQSKSHEKKINQWLKEYCAETGTPMPVRVRRQPELATEVAAAAGQSVFHCVACDLPLTSIQHANQHYTGKRHWMVVNGKRLPSGNGFYNADGKWTRSGNIIKEQTDVPASNGINQSPATAATLSEAKRPRLEPPPIPPQELITGVNWLLEPPSTSTNSATVQPMTVPPEVVVPVAAPNPMVPVAPPNDIKPLLTINVESDDEETNVAPAVDTGAAEALVAAASSMAPLQAVTVGLPQDGSSSSSTTTLEQEIRKKEGLDCVDQTGTFCLICETSVTSRSEMLMHMKGAKHLKKARTKGMAVRTTPFNPSDTILKSLSKPVRKTDWSLYRMPSGKFYCKTCNLIVADEKLFGQHWYGKKHKLKARQEQSADQQPQLPLQLQDPTGSVSNPPDVVINPFASDDIELAPAAYANIPGTGEVGPHKLNLNNPPHRRLNRPFFFNKRPRMVKPRKTFPINSA